MWTDNNDESARAITTYEASIYDRPTLPEALARDTIVDPPRSWVVRASAWVASIGRMIASILRPPRLSDYLPPVSAFATLATNLHAERMLLEVMRAPPEYVDAAILVAHAARALRKRGNDVFVEGFVVFALSRMPSDADGSVQVKHLRECVRDIPEAKGIVPVLLRLEEQGVVSLDAPHERTAGSRLIDMDRVRVRLLVVP